MNVLFRVLILFALAILTSPALADTGPRVPPCEGCPVSSERPYPRSGFWYDPQRSGSGFSIEMQQGILSGAFYGFDETGARTWYIFNGTLQPSEQPGEYWTVETDLLEFSGGGCIDCEHRPNLPPQVRHRMRLTVLQRNLISYSLDGGPQFRVQPLVYGTEMPRLYPQTSDLGLPNYANLNVFGGSPLHVDAGYTPWILTTRNPDQRNFPYYLWTYGMRWSDGFRQGENTGRPVASYLSLEYITESVTDMEIICNSRERMTQSSDIPPALLEGIGPGEFCVVRVPGAGVGVYDFYIAPLGNFGDDYFFATAADGRVIEGMRLLYR